MPSFSDILAALSSQGTNPQSFNPNAADFGATASPQTAAPTGFQFKDPYANMNWLEKLGAAAGGIDNINKTRSDSQASQLAEFKASQDLQDRDALRSIADRLKSGDIDRKQALVEYAARTGDATKLFQQDTTPAAIQEYQYVNGLDSEQRKLYFQNKRANQVVDQGASQIIVGPQGNTVREIDKTLAPEDLPATKAAQTKATAEATADVGRQTTATKQTKDADATLSTIDEAEQYLNDATGSYLGAGLNLGNRIIGNSTDSTKANAALNVIGGKLVLAMPRMEGPQSDKDALLYRQMAANVADPTVPADDKRAALNALRSLQSKYATPTNKPAAGTSELLAPPDMLQPPRDNSSSAPKTVKWGDL